MNDAKTIVQIRNRNEAVIGEVIEKYSRLLWSVASSVLNNIGTVQDVEDCVADTFVYLWENSEKYEPSRGKLKTWLCIIVRTYAQNRCRQIARHNTVSLDDCGFIEQIGVVDGCVKEDTRRNVADAINMLSEPDREILIRRYYYDQKPREIAVALDMSVKSVDNRLYRAKMKLRNSIIK